MTKENLITAPVGTTLDEAEAILQKHKIEKITISRKWSFRRSHHN